MRNMRAICLIAGAVSLGVALDAEAAPITFDFVMVGQASAGNVLGTVTGQVVLDDSLTSQSATSVLITSAPPAFSPIGSVGLSPPYPNDAVLWPTVSSNTFVLSGGVITSALFDAVTYPAYGAPYHRLSFISSQNAWQFQEQSAPGVYDTLRENGVAGGGVFTAATAAVPEPTSLALLATGAFGFMGYGWRRKRKLAA